MAGDFLFDSNENQRVNTEPAVEPNTVAGRLTSTGVGMSSDSVDDSEVDFSKHVRQLIVMHSMFTEGIEQGLTVTAVLFCLRDAYGLSSDLAYLVLALSSIPWLAKPALAYISDRYALFGERRRPYMIIGSAGLSGALGLLALVSGADRGFIVLEPIVLLGLRSLFRGCMAATCQAMMVDESRGGDTSSVASSVAKVLSSQTFGKVFGIALTRFLLVNGASLSVVFGLAATVAAWNAMLSTIYPEDRSSFVSHGDGFGRHGDALGSYTGPTSGEIGLTDDRSVSEGSAPSVLEQARMDIARLLELAPELPSILLFAFLTHVAPHYDVAYSYFLMDRRGFSRSDIADVQLLNAVASFVAPVAVTVCARMGLVNRVLAGVGSRQIGSSPLGIQAGPLGIDSSSLGRGSSSFVGDIQLARKVNSRLGYWAGGFMSMTVLVAQPWVRLSHATNFTLTVISFAAQSLVSMVQYTVTASVVVRMAPAGFEGTSFTMFSGLSVLTAKGVADVLSGLLVFILHANPPTYAGMPLMILVASALNVLGPSQARNVLGLPEVHAIVGGSTFSPPGTSAEIPSSVSPTRGSGETEMVVLETNGPGNVEGSILHQPSPRELASFGSLVIQSSLEDGGESELASEADERSPVSVRTDRDLPKERTALLSNVEELVTSNRQEGQEGHDGNPDSQS